MKKIIFTLLSLCLVYLQANSQHCSTPSGFGACAPADTATQPGLAPLSDSLAPLINGNSVSTYIQFQNFNRVRIPGVPPPNDSGTLIALVIDTLSNLPAGICWASNIQGDSFTNREDGCLALTGTVCAPPGQYKLYIKVIAYVNFLGLTENEAVNGDQDNLYYYIRVNNPGDPITPVDTAGESAGTIHSFIPYGSETAPCAMGINQVGAYINTLTITPNPFNNEAVVSFYSDKVEMMTEKLTNIIGSEVFRKSINVNMGGNTHTIERGTLTPGVYFYTISDGASVYTKRLIITE